MPENGLLTVHAHDRAYGEAVRQVALVAYLAFVALLAAGKRGS